MRPFVSLSLMRQGMRTRRASAYARAQKWIAESQKVIGRAGREAVIHLQPFTATMVGRLSDPLIWLRFMALLCMLMGGLFRMAEPDAWLGHPFASHYEAAKAGYRTLLSVTQVDVRSGPIAVPGPPITRHDLGFQEILELAFASTPYVTDYIAKEQIGPIETIYVRDGALMAGSALIQHRSVQRRFKAPIPIQLEDRQGRAVWATLDYTEAELKERFFMPRLRWWALLAVWAGFMINVLLLPFPSSRRSHQPMRDIAP
jgi:hypothetical protein